ncbi:MAG: energy-coupling factor ABC transporter ATP-binding protein [Mobilitalea sp.]
MIQFNNVSFAYAGQRDGKVKNLSFTVKTGECIVLTGRSGCGKTTITRLVNGLIPEFFEGELTGEVLIDGEELTGKQLFEIAKQVGSVFQNPKTQFFNTDTDGEIAFGMENNGVPREELISRVHKTAEVLKISHLLGRNIFCLSGGEKQKIAFASVYAMNPDIYLLDEPSSNLDIEAINDLRGYIELLKKQGKTILIAEHRLYYLKNLVDKIVYLEEGELRHIWTKEEFMLIPTSVKGAMGLRTLEYREAEIKEREIRKETPALELCNLTVGYGKHQILSGINFKAVEGEIIAVTGQNGVGKSTFSKTLCGLLKPLKGDILWKGNSTKERERLKNAYMVMQDVNYQLFADSVEHECHFGIKNPDMGQVRTTIKEMGLDAYKDRHPNTLSGGQKQRIAVAVSMICKREILIFDEPTSGLDYESMCAVSDLMKTLASMGKIIFVVTHDFELIEQACTAILKLE